MSLSRLLRACLAFAAPLACLVLSAQHAPDPASRSTAPPGLQSLTTGWSFKAGDDPAYASAALDDAGWTPLPDLKDRNAAFPAGRGWYRLKVEQPPQGQPLGLALGRIHAPLEVYANGRRVGVRGSLEPTVLPHTPELTCFELPPSDGPLRLAVRGDIARDMAALAQGPVLGRRVWLGPADLAAARTAAANAEWRASVWRFELERWAMCLFFTLLGLFHIQLWLRRQEARSYLWFGLVALSMAFREVAMTTWMNTSFGHPRFTHIVSWLFLQAAAPPFIQFLWPFLGLRIPRWLRVYQASFLIPAVVLFLPLETSIPFTRYVGPFWGLPLILMAPVVTLLEARRGHPEARTILLGMGLLILGALYELGFWVGLWPILNTLSFGFVAFLVAMVVSISKRYARAHTEMEYLNRTLEERVRARTLELEEAQIRIHRLSESAGQALRDPGAWSTAMAHEVAEAVRASHLDVWKLQEGSLKSLSTVSSDPPALERVELLAQAPAAFLEGSDTLLPVRGMTGELRAAVVVRGKTTPWREAEQRLVTTFAQQLGGALDLARMRSEVESAADRRAATRQALLDAGAGVLQICSNCGRCYDQTTVFCVADGAVLASDRPFPHLVASRYRLKRMLGEGGAGLVFEAEDLRLSRTVALKAIKPEHFHSGDKRLRFEQEARSLAQVHHEGVIGIFDTGVLEDGTIYLVMERLQGATIRVLVDTFGAGTPAQVAALVLQCARALDAVHGKGILHRDIKPDNIFVAPSPGGLRFKLLDFGLAKEMAVDSTLTQTGVVMGTPAYMSPEQIRGAALDPRSDMYALALVAYEALSARRVVQAEALPDILVEVAQGRPVPIRDLVRGLPPDAAMILDEALDKYPEARPPALLPWAERLAAALWATPPEEGGWPEEADELQAGLAPPLRPSTPLRASKPGEAMEPTRALPKSDPLSPQ
ncbi:MAG: protein kinase [Holophagaceae bacterium]|nr:protein kinase [Holophagaceae bacterium]